MKKLMYFMMAISVLPSCAINSEILKMKYNNEVSFFTSEKDIFINGLELVEYKKNIVPSGNAEIKYQGNVYLKYSTENTGMMDGGACILLLPLCFFNNLAASATENYSTKKTPCIATTLLSTVKGTEYRIEIINLVDTAPELKVSLYHKPNDLIQSLTMNCITSKPFIRI